MNKKQYKRIKKDSDIWIELGLRSFARFYALDLEEVITMASNPNDVFDDMVRQMSSSLDEYEDFMVRVKSMDVKDKFSRVDILDL